MKLKVTKQAILDGLQRVQSIVVTKSTLPVLQNVLVQADKKGLSITATDLEVSVRSFVEAEVAAEGGTTIPARRFFSIVRELPEGDIDIETSSEDITTIRCGASLFKLVGISEEDFPPIPTFEGVRSYSLDQGIFKDMLVKTSYAASSDETRQILNGVLLSSHGGTMTVVATDGRRLALVEQEVEFPEKAEGDLPIPSKTVNELMRTLGDEGNLKINASDTQVAFEFDGMLIVSKLLDGTYPNFRQVIPSQSEEHLTIERELFLNAVKRVALLCTQEAPSVKLNLGKNKLEISTESPDAGEARESLAVKYSGKAMAVAFNPEFLMDPLRVLSGDEIILELTDEFSPGVVKSDVPFLYVIMPMRVS